MLASQVPVDPQGEAASQVPTLVHSPAANQEAQSTEKQEDEWCHLYHCSLQPCVIITQYTHYIYNLCCLLGEFDKVAQLGQKTETTLPNIA